MGNNIFASPSLRIAVEAVRRTRGDRPKSSGRTHKRVTPGPYKSYDERYDEIVSHLPEKGWRALKSGELAKLLGTDPRYTRRLLVKAIAAKRIERRPYTYRCECCGRGKNKGYEYRRV